MCQLCMCRSGCGYKIVVSFLIIPAQQGNWHMCQGGWVCYHVQSRLGVAFACIESSLRYTCQYFEFGFWLGTLWG